MSKAAPIAEEFEIAVFAKGVSVKSMASDRIARTEAQHYVDCNVARWVNNRFNSIQMLIEGSPIALRGQSCHVTAKMVMEAAWEGKPSIIAIINAYAYRWAA